METALRERRVVGRSNFSLLIRPDGREFAIDESAAPIAGADGEILGAVFIFHDVSRARSLARQLAHQASHDLPRPGWSTATSSGSAGWAGHSPGRSRRR